VSDAFDARNRRWTISRLTLACAMFVPWVSTAQPAMSPEATASIATPANPLLGIDQNRNTVVDRVVGDWGEALEATRAGLDKAHLRTLLEGLRADQLLAASLAGSLEGLRNVIANALTASIPVTPGLVRTKVLGDAGDDVVYTPITPCRILDSRFSTGGALQSGQVRNWLAANPGGNFGTQGGAATNCGIAIKPAAVMINFTVANTTGAANFLTAWPFNVARPAAATLNWTAPGQQIANAVVVPLCSGGGCTSDFSTYASAQTDLIGDVLGYFAAPAGAVSGVGAAGHVVKWNSASTLGNANLFDVGGQIGVGNPNPAFSLDILASGNSQIRLANGLTGSTALLSRYTNRLEISPSDALQVSVGGTAIPHFWIGTNGNVGIGSTVPLNHLQIGSAPGFSNNDLMIGNGTKGMSFSQSNTASTWFSSTSFALMPAGGTGRVGIGTASPTNQLEVGPASAFGFGGNEFAFSNGVNASGFAHIGGVAQWVSSTDIALMPQGNGRGRVGINTTTPQAPLEVDDYVLEPQQNTSYFLYPMKSVDTCFCTPTTSILAARGVQATEFDAVSDERIKDIVGVSDSVRDLATINALQITDYTLKDVVRNGTRPFKKLIAQQVERVYPQVVSKHLGFIPNVYRVASSVTNEAGGTLLHFDDGHHLTARAKRIELLGAGDSTMRRVGVVAIRSDQDVLVDVPRVDGAQVFVYGEEVEDFRTIDYEGLAALNISATQELARQLAREHEALARKDADITDLRHALDDQAAQIAVLRLENVKLRELRDQVAALQRAIAPVSTIAEAPQTSASASR